MSVTGRITVWLIPSILLWGGCAAPALVNPPATDSTATAGVQQATDGLSPMVEAEAALIRGLALEKGYGPSAADRFEQSVINADPNDRQFLTRLFYAQLNKMDATAPGDQQEDSGLPSYSAAGYDTPHVVSPAFGGPSIPGTSSAAGHASLDRPPWPEEQARPGRSEPTASPTYDQEQSSRSRFTSRHLDSYTDSEPVSPEHLRTSGLSDIDTSDERGANRTRSVDRRVPSRSNGEAGASGAKGTNKDDEEVSWQRQLRLAIARLRREMAENKELDRMDESRYRAYLSLLQLAAENPEGAMESLDGLDEQQLEFWKQIVWGLDILLDSDELPKMRHRVESAAVHLNRGLVALESTGPLRVDNLAFVSDVLGFGEYQEITPHTFKPGDQALLYVQIGNFTTELIAGDEAERTSTTTRRRQSAPQVPMYETELSGRYDILDQNQRVVLSRTLPIVMDRCRQQRRDFFIPYDFSVPQDIAPGYYTVELTIKDRRGDKFGSGSIDMKIR